MPSDGFLTEAVNLDGVSVTIEDGDYLCTCDEQSEGKINATPVCESAYRHGLEVIGVVGDFDRGTVRVRIARLDSRGDSE